MDIRSSTRKYEDWLKAELGDEFVAKDLQRKHERMAAGAFPFLRATYWRWAETILGVCPELEQAPRVLAVGDIHLENFGTWRDVDGRLVWGVNDFDEAAEMPWALDPLRLATSALLARAADGPEAGAICDAIMAGYAKALAAPRPIVLEREHPWLRGQLLLPEDERAAFWEKMEPPARADAPPQRWADALTAAMPAGAQLTRIWRRVAGTGSLGRPRWVAAAEWRGGVVLREAKGVVTSGWLLPPGRGHRALRCLEAATGRYRVPDPWYNVANHIAVRRLSPNNRKIDVRQGLDLLLGERMLAAMGHELASVHCGHGNAARDIGRDLAGRKRHWLARAAERAADFVRGEQAEYAKP